VGKEAWELAPGAVQWKKLRNGGVGSLRDVPQQAPKDVGGQNMSVQDTTDAATGVILSEPAAAKVKALLDQEGRDDLRLRIAVQPGGCSGLRYQLFFDERFLDGDQTYEYGGVEVIVDRMSGPYLGGATIDFVDTIEKQGFTIDNPNAGGSCACGDSFH
jgi:iron-sulfur cluster assembly accessory protein